MLILSIFLTNCAGVKKLEIFKEEVPRAKLNLEKPTPLELENLRWINKSGNMRNKVSKGKYLKGVYKNGVKFVAQIKNENKHIYLGTFETEEQAHQAYLTKYNELMEIF